MYVLSLILKEKIDKNINKIDMFLNDSSKWGYLLYELTKKNDMKYFFKNVLI